VNWTGINGEELTEIFKPVPEKIFPSIHSRFTSLFHEVYSQLFADINSPEALPFIKVKMRSAASSLFLNFKSAI